MRKGVDRGLRLGLSIVSLVTMAGAVRRAEAKAVDPCDNRSFDPGAGVVIRRDGRLVATLKSGAAVSMDGKQQVELANGTVQLLRDGKKGGMVGWRFVPTGSQSGEDNTSGRIGFDSSSDRTICP